MHNPNLPGEPSLEVIFYMEPKEKPNKKPIVRDGDMDRPIPEDIYPVIDTDLARDNLENDIPAADLQDL